MNRTQTACFALLASAFLLAAILIVQIDRKAQPNTAQADGQNIYLQTFQMMTARTRGDSSKSEESLFILDNNAGVLLVYSPNVGRKQVEPVAAIKLADIFGGAAGGGR